MSDDEGVSNVVVVGGGNDDMGVSTVDDDVSTTSPFSLSFQSCPLVTFCCRCLCKMYRKRPMIEPATIVMAIAIRTHCQTNSVAMYIHRFGMLDIYNVKRKEEKNEKIRYNIACFLYKITQVVV